MGGLQEFVLSEVHALYNIPTIIEDPPDVLRVYGARKVRVAVVPTVPTRRTDAL